MKKLELMAPAGNLKSFLAALEGGADSVYLGYLKFNARRPADNFDALSLRKVINFAHQNERKVYITLNIDIKNGELQEAARIMEFLCQIGADAIIVKDLGLVEILQKFYKGKIEYHASTQSAITSSFGAAFAEKLGFSRAVLARELSIEEIRAVIKRVSIETEIFVEGSMCFSVSGRCYMSSWVGGRSGNRGGCTAPCRCIWNKEGEKYPFFSMKDMLLVTHLKEIEESGVNSLKIEGRLKNFAWVYVITSTYRDAIDSINDTNKIEKYREELKKYSARDTGEGHFFDHSQLIGKNENWENYQKGAEITLKADEKQFSPTWSVVISPKEDRKWEIRIQMEEEQQTYCIPQPPPPRKGRAGTLSSISGLLSAEFPGISIKMEEPEYQTTARDLQKITNEIVFKIKHLQKRLNQLPELPGGLKANIEYHHQDHQRERLLGNFPDKVIIDKSQFQLFAEQKIEGIQTVTAAVSPDTDLNQLKKVANNYDLIVSLPHVIYETDALRYQKWVESLLQENFKKIEVNSFTGMELLSSSSCEIYGGIGIPVLNYKAADLLYRYGCKSVYASCEAEAGVLESLSQTVNGNLETLMFARLALFISRVSDENYQEGALFRDNIGTEIECRRLDGINYFYSKQYFALIGEEVRQKKIHMNSLTADLRYIKSPIEILKNIKNNRIPVNKINRFNFDRKLV